MNTVRVPNDSIPKDQLLALLAVAVLKLGGKLEVEERKDNHRNGTITVDITTNNDNTLTVLLLCEENLEGKRGE